VPFSLTLPLSNVLPSSNKKSITIPSPPRHVDFLDRKKGKEKQSAQGGNFDERERENYLKSIRSLTPLLIFYSEVFS
jgi:hypothetical protein